MNASEIVFRPVRQLAGLVRERKVSPTELAEVFLERLERIGPRYNAVVTLMPDRAMEEAERAEREIASGEYRGPLHGIPYGLKDLFAGGRRSDLVGRDAVQGPGLPLRLDRRAKAQRGRGGAARQAGR